MNIGDKVIPKTPAGLWLADVPTNGEYNQITKEVCVFTGIGTVIDVFDCVIDYDEWDRQKDDDDVKYDIGKVEYRSCLVQFEGGQGWAGSGALKLNLESK